MGCNNLIKVASRLNIEQTFVDATDPTKIEAAIRPSTKMVWIKIPTSLTLKGFDIRAVAPTQTNMN